MRWRTVLRVSSPLHHTYLPFTADVLKTHFANVAGNGDADRHVRYYQESLDAFDAFQAATASAGTAAEKRSAATRGLQIQKDERFWVAAALMGLYYSPDRVAALASLLTYALGPTPPIPEFNTWADALGEEQHVFFEANLPSPEKYRAWLGQHLDERVLIPHIRERAASAKKRLEGATKVDAILVVPDTGFAVLFEAKVLSDVSGTIEFDVVRNQLARIIDVSLDANPRLEGRLAARNPDRTCVVMLTPEIFQRQPESRLYGWLVRAYREDPALLAKHLPHRDQDSLRRATTRLGWATWEDCNRSHPGVCGWLPTVGSGIAADPDGQRGPS
jgi:hypothetical protein